MSGSTMYFESRALKPWAEPVDPDDLEVGTVYFLLSFADAALLIPHLEPIVFAGRNLGGEQGDEESVYFQDCESYRRGIRSGGIDDTPENVTWFIVRPEQIKNVFEYERALDQMLACSIRRRNAG